MSQKMDRREFVKKGGLLLAGSACAYGLPLMTTVCKASIKAGEGSSTGRKWGMVIELGKCRSDCTACVNACREENNVAHFGNEDWDIHLIRKAEISRIYPVESREKRPILLLCNQCDDPPCAQACPVQATYQRPDGITICDQHRCIGCRYCLIACPYNARFFYYKEDEDWPNKNQTRSTHGVTHSCNFCVHRLDRNGKPACVEACAKAGAGAIHVGDLNDPKSEVSGLIAENPVQALREDLGTKPKVFYIGL